MTHEAGDAREGTGLAGTIAARLLALEKKFNVKKGYHLPDAIARAFRTGKYCGYVDTNYTLGPATWSDLDSNATIVDSEKTDISRSGSDFTFANGGTYVVLVSAAFRSNAAADAGLRLRKNGTTILQAGTSIGAAAIGTVVLQGTIEVDDGEVVTIEQVCTSSQSVTVPTIDGETLRYIVIEFVSL